MEQKEGHPILSGLAALVGVGAVIGLILGGAALVGTKAAGLDGRTAAAEDSATESLYLPSPSPSRSPTAPLVTLPGGSTPTIPTPTGLGTNTQAVAAISLESTSTSFKPDQEIDLSGTYQAGEGAVLEVQRLADDGTTWGDFATVTATVTDGTFYTFIRTTHVGPAQFRMWDGNAQLASNVLTLTIE